MKDGPADWTGSVEQMINEYLKTEASDLLRKLTKKVLDSKDTARLLECIAAKLDQESPERSFKLFVIFDSLGQQAAKASRHAQSLEQVGEIIRGPIAQIVQLPALKPQYPRIEKMITIWKAKDVFPPHIIRSVHEAMEGIVSTAPSLEVLEDTAPPVTSCNKIRSPSDVERVLRKMEEIRRNQKQIQYEQELRQRGEDPYAEMDEFAIRWDMIQKQQQQQRTSPFGRNRVQGSPVQKSFEFPESPPRISGQKRIVTEMYSPCEELQLHALTSLKPLQSSDRIDDVAQPSIRVLPPSQLRNGGSEMYSVWDELQQPQPLPIRQQYLPPEPREPHYRHSLPPRQEPPRHDNRYMRNDSGRQEPPHGHRSQRRWNTSDRAAPPSRRTRDDDRDSRDNNNNYHPHNSTPYHRNDRSHDRGHDRDDRNRDPRDSHPRDSHPRDRDRDRDSHRGDNHPRDNRPHDRDSHPRDNNSRDTHSRGGRGDSGPRNFRGGPRSHYDRPKDRGPRSHEKEPYNWELPERAKRR